MKQRHCIRVSVQPQKCYHQSYMYAVTRVRQRADRYVPCHTNGGLADELELLVWPATRQNLLQFGCCEEELEVHLSVCVVFLVLLDGNVHSATSMCMPLRVAGKTTYYMSKGLCVVTLVAKLLGIL